MSKGQQRSNTEVKKPKQKKAPPVAPSSVVRVFSEAAAPKLKMKR
ncbi:hypothetical protein CLV79_107148 [Limimaricola soesokkakensis]|uniref:Uncharacterized protein n=1 Tax=Limimaricola soesokkakensis TaxID=1343159 RepID=A0A1X6ZLQ3_9RHOB|nr:hypothetical protein [Limimaricola soesokkakensis]PSK85918.1 hypothetical protein CLV79_107148 [Limimaricola soesokkakensis]SLN55097.1 hypothetical protein LOS8367_02592 [Limimaricola soesokkakensis]